YHHAIAVVCGADGHRCWKLCAELTGSRVDSAADQLLPRRVPSSVCAQSSDDRGRRSESGRNKRRCSDATPGGVSDVYRFHLFPHLWDPGKLEKNQIQKELAKHHEVHAGPRRRESHRAEDHSRVHFHSLKRREISKCKTKGDTPVIIRLISVASRSRLGTPELAGLSSFQ